MRHARVLLIVGGMLAGLSGCRCCFLFEPYHDLVDHINDHQWAFDPWYCPRLDISRAGKPDWCGPINRRLGPCRCDCVSEWTRYDDIWLYPPRYPFEFPNQSFPGPTQHDPAEMIEEMEIPDSAPLEPRDPSAIPDPPLPESPQD